MQGVLISPSVWRRCRCALQSPRGLVSMDPPLKKRRLLEPTPDTSTAPHQELCSPKLPLSQEEIMIKRRNRDEIRKVHDCYKRIRFYISQKNSRLNPDFEQTYLHLITASSGCSSVRRIIAELIPRYAIFCPNVIESAAKILVNMHNSSMSVIKKGDDADGVVYHTAKACIFGLVDICSTAASEASASSITRDNCASVFSITFDFLISALKGDDIYTMTNEEIEEVQKPLDLFRELRLEKEDGDKPMSLKLSRVLILCAVKILLSCPRDLLGACFDFISSHAQDEGKRKKGFCFINQATTPMNKIQETLVSDIHDKEISIVDISMDNEFRDTHDRLSPRSICLLEMVICEEPSLKDWMLSKLRELHWLLPSETSDELSQFVKRIDGFLLRVFQSLDTIKDGNKDNDTSLGHHASIGECEKPTIQTTKPEVFQKPAEVSGEISSSIEKSRICAKEESSDKPIKKACDGTEDNRKAKQKLDKDIESTGTEYGQTIWYFDGDPASMDVYPASNQLWIGSLGRDASDTVVRLQFEDFGPVNHFFFFGALDFALIEYRNVMDAVRAREFMGGSSPWGSPLRVKFMDSGLGSRGSFHSIAIGESSHVYVRKILNHRAKDELIQGLISSGLNGPRAVTEIVSESALMLEFLNAEQAVLAMDHIRKRQRDGGSCKDSDGSFSQLIVRSIDSSISEEELISAFSVYGEILRYKFNQQSSLCSIDFRSFEASNLAKSRLNGARFGAKQISIESSASNLVSLPSTSNAPNSSVNDYIISELSSLSSSISSRYGINDSSIVHCVSSSDENQVTSNTLHISLADVVSQSFDEELRDFCNLAARNAGSVLRLTRSNAEKSFWVVEFDCVDGAVSALNHIRNCPGVFFHVQFRNDSSMATRNITGHFPAASNTGKESQTIDANEVSQGKEQNREYDNHAKEHHQPSCLPALMHPSWDAHTKNPSLAPHTCLTAPFIPPSVTPLSHIAGTSLSSTSPSLLPPPPPPLPPPPPPPPPPNSPPPSHLHAASEVSFSKSSDVSTSYQWQGSLCKSGALYCSVHAKRENSEKCKYSAGFSEPADWPSKLDVTQRTAFRNVASTFSSAQPHKREVCRLSPSAASDVKGLRDFAGYLKQRECAGVIKLPAAGSMWARVLFILPNSSKACSMLGILHDTSDCLLALVLPKDTGVDS